MVIETDMYYERSMFISQHHDFKLNMKIHISD